MFIYRPAFTRQSTTMRYIMMQPPDLHANTLQETCRTWANTTRICFSMRSCRIP